MALQCSRQAVLGAPEHAMGFVTSPCAKASCCGSDLSKMFPQ